MPKLDPDFMPRRTGSTYPTPFDEPCAARVRRALGDAGGLNDFGVNLLELPAGAWSSQRHWHSAEDEFVYVLDGEVVLIDDEGNIRFMPAIARRSRRETRTAISWSTGRTRRRSVSKSAAAAATTSAPIPTSTCA